MTLYVQIAQNASPKCGLREYPEFPDRPLSPCVQAGLVETTENSELPAPCIYANQFEIFIGNNDMVRRATRVMETPMYKENILSITGRISHQDCVGSCRAHLYRKRVEAVRPA